MSRTPGIAPSTTIRYSEQTTMATRKFIFGKNYIQKYTAAKQAALTF
jgi:hypothetical protein